MQRPATIHRRTDLLRDAIAVMEADFAQPISLDDVAQRIATSRRQLQRCFDELHDATFRSCLARIRMRRAAALLAGTPLPVHDVAARVGYSQPAQFAKAFTRHHGMPPSHFRAERRRDARALRLAARRDVAGDGALAA
jgi:AraC family transcriptional regulator, regulatory protein of adaptative response / methylphosphotriester-DNA alkyltransferase methyltransferase